MFEMMLLPFIACLVLAAVHVYLGFHVLERGVIFVDIALAQIAALGFIAAYALGIPFKTLPSYLVGLGATVSASALFALTRLRSGAVPQEAVIGIVYVVSAALAILVLNFSPKESEHLKHMLVGDILFVSWAEVAKILVIYAVAGLFHFAFRRQFWAVSRNPQKAADSGIRVPLWDFFFYASFGFVVTSSVEIAGVLLVFAFLIMPTAAAVLLAQGLGPRLLLGWALAAATSAAGLAASFHFDMPTGAAVVCAFGALVLGAGLLRLFIRK